MAFVEEVQQEFSRCLISKGRCVTKLRYHYISIIAAR